MPDISDADRARLKELAESDDKRLSLPALIVLLSLKGMTDSQIANLLDTSRKSVCLWRRQYREGGLDAIKHARPPTTSKSKLPD